MFENLLYQNVSSILTSDIKNNTLPSSILLSGPESSGKLTCALELARILSCTSSSNEKGSWLCDCPSCKKHKELANTNLILSGPRDCSLEILASKRTLLEAGFNNLSYITAARYLFIRSVRKLLLRFSPIFWEGDDKLSKLSPLVEEINDELEKLNPELSLPENSVLESVTSKIVEKSEKLESTFMYDSLPIEHIRRSSFWLHLKSPEGKKVLVIENADRMNESCRNALLKILEEPPADSLFILTTSRRGAVMPTILSRVRTYSFNQRSIAEQQEVIERVFHDDVNKGDGTIAGYLQTFLPISPEKIQEAANDFYQGIKQNTLFQLDDFVNRCANFEPKTIFKLFLQFLILAQRNQNEEEKKFACDFEIQAKNLKAIKDCYNSVSLFNQKPLSALETLYRDLAFIKKSNLR